MNTTLTPAQRIAEGRLSLNRLLDHLAPVADLAARLYVGKVFFTSGLTKLRDWDTTLFLFREEYSVPLLPPDLAAVVGTGGELTLPMLLVFGLFTRLSALGLFVLNLVAVVSYYATLVTSAPAIQDHLEWGLILALLMVTPARLCTVDRLLLVRGRPDHYTSVRGRSTSEYQAQLRPSASSTEKSRVVISSREEWIPSSL